MSGPNMNVQFASSATAAVGPNTTVDCGPLLKTGPYGVAVCNDGVWEVVAGTQYVSLEDVILAAGANLNMLVGPYWNNKNENPSQVAFVDATSGDTAPADANYLLVSKGQKPVAGATSNVFQGWGTEDDSSVFTKGDDEPQLGPNTLMQPPAAIVFDAQVYPISSDAKTAIDGAVAGGGGVRLVMGNSDGSSCADNEPDRLPAGFTTIKVYPTA